MTGAKINLCTVYPSTCIKPRGWVTIEEHYIRLFYPWCFNNDTRNRYYNSLILQDFIFVKPGQISLFLSIFISLCTSKGPESHSLPPPHGSLLCAKFSLTTEGDPTVAKAKGNRNEKIASSDLQALIS